MACLIIPIWLGGLELEGVVFHQQDAPIVFRHGFFHASSVEQRARDYFAIGPFIRSVGSALGVGRFC
jgi:hypothetical protein